MRILVVAALGWMAGILVQGTVGGPALAWAAVAIAAAGAALVLGRRAALFVAALGCAAVAAAIERPAAPARSGALAGVVARPDEELHGERRVLVDLEDGGRTQVVEREARSAVLPGDRVRFTGTARPVRGPTDEGAFDRRRDAAARGIDLEAHIAAPGLVVVAAPAEPSVWRVAAMARARAAAALAATSSGDGGALVQALVLGRRGAVRPELDDAFRRAGVSHVLSVSGVHLAAVALLAFVLARRAWLLSARLTARVAADRAAALVVAPIAVAYTLLTGAEIATVRALLCALAVLGAKALGRAPDALSALAAAALALLVTAPAALYEPSFQLSFAATAALALVGRRLRGPRTWRRRLLAAVAASAAAAAATAPLTALAFGVVQPGGIVANLVVVPIAELVVLPLGLLGGVLGMIAPAAGATFGAAAGLAASALARLVEVLAAVLPVWEVPPPRPLELAALGAAVVAALALPWRRALLPAALGLAVAAASYTWSFAAGRDDLEVTFLDVGQGDAALIDTPGGARWLVDSGGRLFGDGGADPGETVRRFLAARRVRRLDVVVISHPHPDHYGGLAALLDHVAIGEVWISGDDPGDARWAALVARLGARVVRAGAGRARESGGARLALVAPAGPDPDRSVNDNSLVARVTFAGRSVLFAGDLEAGGEAALLPAIGAMDVVKVPHHGSRTSSSLPFVTVTHPALAVVSCGRDNRFGFPAAAVVARWRAAGARVARTDVEGAIAVRVTADGTLTERPPATDTLSPVAVEGRPRAQ